MWDGFLALLSVLGVGSLVGIFASHWLGRRAAKDDRSYAEKTDAYLKFLDAWRARAERAQDYAYWRSRIELLGSAEVIRRVRGIEVAETYSYEDVENTYPLLIDAMRDDLAKGPSEEICDASLKSFGEARPQ